MKKKIYNIVLVQDKCDKKYYVVNSRDYFEFFENYNREFAFYTIGKIMTVYEDELEMIQDMLYAIATNDDDMIHKKISATKVWIEYDYNLSHFSDTQKEEMVNHYEKGYLNNDLI